MKPTYVTSASILNKGLSFKLQSKGHLDKQLHEWQMRQDAHKQAERMETAHRLSLERNLKILKMRSMTEPHMMVVSDKSNMLNEDNVDGSNKQIMVPLLGAHPATLMLDHYQQIIPYPMATIPFIVYNPVDMALANSPTSTYEQPASCHIPQGNCHNTSSEDICEIPQLPSQYTCMNDYQASQFAWLNWHRTTPPTPYVRSVSPPQRLSPSVYDPSLMRLDYLPFTCEDEITNQETDSNIKCSSMLSFDSDDEEYINVLC